MARTGQDQIAQSAEPGEGFGLCAQGHGQPCHFGKATGDDGGMGAAAQISALDNAAGNGQHILHGPARFGPDQIGG
jgi:hypothetical protein